MERKVVAIAEPIGVRLLHKEVGPEQAKFTVRSSNRTHKGIREFVGFVMLTDLLGGFVLSMRIVVNEPIAAGADLTWSEVFAATEDRFRYEPRENLKAAFYTTEILFEDGFFQRYVTYVDD